MRISRLLFLAMLASSLCMVGSVFGTCISELSDSAAPNLGEYNLGETINYELCVGVPDSILYCTLNNVCVYFYPPGSEPTGTDACDNPGSDPNAVLIACISSLAPGDSNCYDGNDNPALDYLVEETSCDANGTVVARMAVTFEVGGIPDCDRKTIVNTILPVDSPPCGILGPTEVCEGSDGEIYCSQYEADGYLWAVTGGADIVGPDDANCVLVDPNGNGDYTVYLMVCNDNGGDGCCSDCNLPVTVIDAPDCLINGPDSICASDSAIQFCSDVNDADSYFWEIVSGDATISGSDLGECVMVVPGTSAQFELKLSICYHDPNCCDSCTKTVDVIETPNCLIDGPNNVCVDSNTVYCSNAEADTYLWEIVGDGAIVGPNDTNCVTVSVGATGSFLLSLTVCNIADTNDCCNSCELEVTIEECGGAFCTYTQGFYGNAGGTACDGVKTKDLINALIDGGADPVVVGVKGENSITLDDADCIIKRLPAGGTPMPLPDIGDVNDNCDNPSKTALADVLKKQGRYNNVLIGQVVALTLNLRLYEYGCDEEGEDLASWVLPAEFCVMGKDGCPKKHEIPESLQGMMVGELLALANDYLAGVPDGVEVSDLYKGVTAINEGFDGCREVVVCPTEEICDNGCDDDFDGYIDLADDDCVSI